MVDELELPARRLKKMALSKLHEAVAIVDALDAAKLDVGEVIDDAIDEAYRLSEEAGMHLNRLMHVRDDARKERSGG